MSPNPKVGAMMQVAKMLDSRITNGHFVKFMGAKKGTLKGGMEAMYADVHRRMDPESGEVDEAAVNMQQGRGLPLVSSSWRRSPAVFEVHFMIKLANVVFIAHDLSQMLLVKLLISCALADYRFKR